MKLKKLYSLIPEISCKKNCTICCGPIFMLPSEAKNIGLPEGRLHTNWDKDFNCEFKTSHGCSIYENRPFICRFFGITDSGLFSCDLTKGDIIPAAKGNVLMELYAELLINSNNMPAPNSDILNAMYEHDRLMKEAGNPLTRFRPDDPVMKSFEEKD